MFCKYGSARLATYKQLRLIGGDPMLPAVKIVWFLIRATCFFLCAFLLFWKNKIRNCNDCVYYKNEQPYSGDFA